MHVVYNSVTSVEAQQLQIVTYIDWLNELD